MDYLQIWKKTSSEPSVNNDDETIDEMKEISTANINEDNKTNEKESEKGNDKKKFANNAYEKK